MKKWISFFLILLLASCTKKEGGDFTAPNPGNGNSGNKGDGNPLYDAETYKEKSKAIFDNIIKYYSIGGTNYFLENYPRQGGDRQVAYFWSHSTLFTDAILLKSLGYNDLSIQKVIDGLDNYWDVSRTPYAFQSYPTEYGGGDRFYDDNAIAGIDDVLAYKVTNEEKYLRRAEDALAFDMSGESQDQGGGIFWSEQKRLNNPTDPNTVKAANSSALSVTLALKLYQITEKPQYLNFAERVYNWNKTTLQDPTDKNYWNDIHAITGKINKTKWAYNSGAMITNAVLLYKITDDAAFLDEAKVVARASYNYFTTEIPGLGRFFPSHDPYFTMHLFRAYLDLYEVDKNPEYINTLIMNVDYAWKSARNSSGFFLEDWSGKTRGREHWLINQTCMVEIYALISKFKNE
jgi:rhamnogalacturonyl hydrolase YesR